MKRSFLGALAAVSILLAGLQGCMKSEGTYTYSYLQPVLRPLTEVRAEMKAGAPRSFKTTGKIYQYGNYIFLNEPGAGIHLIDNANPAAPRNTAFIPIPGNADIAVKGNYLYADSYSDIVVFDISQPLSATPVRFMNNVLKDLGYYWGDHTNPDSVLVPTDFVRRDTVVSLEEYERLQNCFFCPINGGGLQFFTSFASGAGGGTGTAGSMARFGIVNNFLYSVTNSKLYAIDIAAPAQPVQRNMINLGWGIETIYPFRDKLFIGSNTGMFIYDVSNGAQPQAQGSFSHARSCDPVVTDGQYAYVTLRSGNTCAGNINQLDVLDVNDVQHPSLVKTYGMQNPRGLAKDGSLLIVCDGNGGVKWYDVTNPSAMVLKQTVSLQGSYDVIAQHGRALVVAEDGLYQYSYTGDGSVNLLSKLRIVN